MFPVGVHVPLPSRPRSTLEPWTCSHRRIALASTRPTRLSNSIGLRTRGRSSAGKLPGTANGSCKRRQSIERGSRSIHTLEPLGVNGFHAHYTLKVYIEALGTRCSRAQRVPQMAVVNVPTVAALPRAAIATATKATTKRFPCALRFQWLHAVTIVLLPRDPHSTFSSTARVPQLVTTSAESLTENTRVAIGAITAITPTLLRRLEALQTLRYCDAAGRWATCPTRSSQWSTCAGPQPAHVRLGAPPLRHRLRAG
jgi:hypothetical protein